MSIMTRQFLIGSLLICNSILHTIEAVVDTDSNQYDTYNADECQRVRRSWTSLQDEEKQLYIDGIMELRSRGELNPSIDEFIVIGSVHEDNYGGEDHFASNYLFWHGYMLWELESRIRNLGGRFKCFAVPYWQFTTGAPASGIFDKHLGGEGNPQDFFKVNEYSWKHTTQEFWVPAHCDATGDQFPICSLKRNSSLIPQPTALQMGRGITQHPVFADFDRWYSHHINLPHDFLIDNEYLRRPVVTQYDPIWYLFHSMVSYHQAIWTDCNNYDQIPFDELEEHPEAYKPFCDAPCGKQGLDDTMHYGGGLPDAEWSFIHNQDLTVRKSYYLPQWNVIYDLGDASGFYAESGLKEYCAGNLNPNWFMFSDPQAQSDAEFQTDADEQQSVMELANLSSQQAMRQYLSLNELTLSLLAVVLIGCFAFSALYCKNNKATQSIQRTFRIKSQSGYGSV